MVQAVPELQRVDLLRQADTKMKPGAHFGNYFE
jgi:hypothetical protein